jgi:hypothetical protein
MNDCADEKKDVLVLDGYIFSGLSDELKQHIVVSSALMRICVASMHVSISLIIIYSRISGCSIWETGCSRKS